MANREEWGLHTVPLLGCTFKRAASVGRDVIGLVALDFVLRIVLPSVMHMTLVVEIRGVDSDDGPRHPACFRIPAYMIADLEPLGHPWDSLFLSEALLSIQSHHCAPRHAHRRQG